MCAIPNTTHLLYLHGFRSSPQSAKARLCSAYVAQRHPSLTWWCPQLPPSPREAMALVMDGISAWPKASIAVIGSSLGGFYATHVAARTGCSAVLLNPAVNPARDLARHIGEHSAWHHPEERFFFKPEFVNELKALEVDALPSPDRLFAVIAQGDEVLDWREMRDRYASSHLRIVAGGDHALSDFESAHLAPAMSFLGL